MFIACEPIFTAVWIVFYLTLHRFLEGIDYVGMSHNMEYTFFVQIFLITQIIIYIFFHGKFDGEHHLSCNSFYSCARGEIAVTKYI